MFFDTNAVLVINAGQHISIVRALFGREAEIGHLGLVGHQGVGGDEFVAEGSHGRVERTDTQVHPVVDGHFEVAVHDGRRTAAGDCRGQQGKGKQSESFHRGRCLGY